MTNAASLCRSDRRCGIRTWRTTYELVATGDPDVFYRGDIAERIDADMRANGGLLRKQDLAAYRTETTTPLRGRYRGLDIATNRPPGGGVMLIEMLNMLECFDLRGMGHNSPEYIRTLAEMMKIATADKDAHVGDPRFTDVPLERLTDKNYAAEQAAFISSGGRRHVERLALAESSGTTHLCVVDQQGAIVTMTHSLGHDVGRDHPGTGVHVQRVHGGVRSPAGPHGLHRAGEVTLQLHVPHHPLRPGPAPACAGRPGRHANRDGGAADDRQLRRLRHDARRRRCSHPRFSATSDTILVTARIPRYRYRELESDGYRFHRSPYSYQIASVHAIGFDENGEASGAADIPYGDGMAFAGRLRSASPSDRLSPHAVKRQES